MVWEIISIISLIISILFIVQFIYFQNKINNKYHHKYNKHTFVRDVLLDKKTIDYVQNYVFSTNEDISETINKYVLSYKKKQTYLICNFSKQLKYISMTVYAYNENEKLIGVYGINELVNSEYSSLIKLPSKTKYVNIKIKRTDIVLSQESEKITDYKKLIKIETVALFFGIFPISYYLARILGFNLYDQYLMFVGFFIALITSFILCIINYIVINKLLFKTNSVKVGEYFNE